MGRRESVLCILRWTRNQDQIPEGKSRKTRNDDQDLNNTAMKSTHRYYVAIYLIDGLYRRGCTCGEYHTTAKCRRRWRYWWTSPSPASSHFSLLPQISWQWSVFSVYLACPSPFCSGRCGWLALSCYVARRDVTVSRRRHLMTTSFPTFPVLRPVI